MKYWVFILFLGVIQACDPYNFGFKKNPAYILNEAFEAILDEDINRFLEVSAKEALCVYGNEQGMKFLKDKFNLKPKHIQLNPAVLESQYFNNPLFVDFWAYYSERFMVEVKNKKNDEALVNVIVDCHYGTDGEKNDKFINLKPSKYKIKSCEIVKIISEQFDLLPLNSDCAQLKINL
jgi:hypothetical protein